MISQKPRKLFINGRFLSQAVTGAQRYAEELVKALDILIGQEPELSRWSLEILAPRDINRRLSLKNISLRQMGFLTGNAWEQLELPWHARGEFLFNPCNAMPYGHSRQIVAVYDAVVFVYPEAFSLFFRAWRKSNQLAAGKIARAIITCSQFSKDELAKLCGFKEEKTHVVYPGIEHILSHPADDSIIKRHNLDQRPFILAVSTANRYKNFAAVNRLSQRLEKMGKNVSVIAAGGKNIRVFGHAGEQKLSHIQHLGSPTNAQLRALYEAAAGFLFPSFYEGFGFPPMEAMACGCPVIAARTASIPEVCGEAALYCDPTNDEDIFKQVCRVLDDADLRKNLREKSLARAREFTWGKCAREFLKVSESVIT